MKYSSDTFIRSQKNESALWNRRTSACVIFRDAEHFLNAVGYDDRPVEEIVRTVAASFGCFETDVEKDVKDFLNMLEAESYCIGENGADSIYKKQSGSKTNPDEKQEKQSNAQTVLGGFFTVHHLASDLHVDLTSGCTERCIHCYIPDYTPPEKKTVSPFASRNSVKTFLISGKGKKCGV